jgi:hypothetical protein
MNQVALTLHNLVYFAASNATAPDGTSYPTGLPSVSATGGNGYNDLQTILTIVFGVIGAVAVIFVIIGALKYITSQGDPQSTAKAKDTILYAIIGLVLALSAELIVTYVLNNL